LIDAAMQHVSDFIAGAEVAELRRLALLHRLEIDCEDHEELSAMLLSFFSSADRRSVFINELRDAFPALRDESDLIASLLESTDLCISHALLTQLADFSESGDSTPFTLLQLGCGEIPFDVFAQAPGNDARWRCRRFVQLTFRQAFWLSRAQHRATTRFRLLFASKTRMVEELRLLLCLFSISVLFERALRAPHNPPRACSFSRRCSTMLSRPARCWTSCAGAAGTRSQQIWRRLLFSWSSLSAKISKLLCCGCGP
jgi:hypothetical protein